MNNFWLVEWNLEGHPSRIAETLPHPTQHIVIDPSGTSGIFGLQPGKFSHVLGTGKAVGLKFHPGAFRGFFGKRVSLITDRILPIEEVSGTSNTLSVSSLAGLTTFPCRE